MKIQTKLTLIVLFILFSLILVVLLFYYTSKKTTILVNKEKETILLGIEWNNLINHTNNLLVNDWKIDELAIIWNESIAEFDISLNAITGSVLLRQLGENVIKKLDTIQSVWRLTRKNLENIKGELDTYISKRIPFSQRPLLFLYGYYYTKEEERDNFYQLSELNRVILNFQKSQVIFTNTLTFSAEYISNEIESWKNRIFIMASIISIFLITFSLVFSWFFSNKIANRIALVGNAVEKVSRGDFTTKLNIKTNDEFEILSNEFNTFIENLKNNVESVLDFMKDIDTAVSNKVNIPRLLKLITEAALEDTNANGAAILMIDEENESLKVEAISGQFPPPYKVSSAMEKENEDVTGYFKDKILKLGELLLGENVKNDNPVFIKNSNQDKRLKYSTDKDALCINSIIIVPLKVQKRILGAILIVTTDKEMFLTDLDFTHLKAFADYAAISIQNLINEMQLQAGLLDTIKKTPNSHRIINKARIYLEKNYQYQLMVEDVAREVSLSTSHFKKIFKRDIGFTFSSYLNMLRIEKAKELLLKSEMSITEIAYDIGYNDSNYFSTVFKNIEGMSPREYRKKIRTSPVNYFVKKEKTRKIKTIVTGKIQY